MAVRRSLAPIAHTAEYIVRNVPGDIKQLVDMLWQCKGGVVAITGAGESPWEFSDVFTDAAFRPASVLLHPELTQNKPVSQVSALSLAFPTTAAQIGPSTSRCSTAST